jgi:hypothetical protein
MGKRAVIILLAFCLASGAACGQAKFKFAPGTVVVGGSVSMSMLQSFNSSPISFLTVSVTPLFGQFLTKDTMLFSFCNFQLNVDFNSWAWEGGLDLGAQGRYFFSTDAPVDFFLGLMVAFGLKLRPNYAALQEHVVTGPTLGLFVPMNDKVAFDFSFNPVFYIPLNSYQPFAMYISVSAGIVSAL